MVNKTEIIAKKWLIKNKGYKEDDIIKNARGTPDFICSDGKRYEVKFFNGSKIMFTNHQVKSMKPIDSVLVFDREKFIGKFLWKKRDQFFIKIYYWDANRDPKIVVDEETKKELDKIKLHPRETYGDVIKRLLKKGD